MSLLNKLDQKFGQYAIPQLTFGLIVCQVVTTILGFFPNGHGILDGMALRPEMVLHGEVWRVLTFLILPPYADMSGINLLWAFFYWQMLYIMGSTLENLWGHFKFNFYFLIGLAATVAVSFLPHAAIYEVTNAFLYSSIFLAFAYLYPDFEILLFFVFPVRIKWLALITWIFYGIFLLFGSMLIRFLVLAAIANFLLFFGKEILDRMHEKQKTSSRRLKLVGSDPGYFHKCAVCGITDTTHPKMEFRYCDKCTDGKGYCRDHLFNHEHS